jgi:hypothetical protein
LRRKYASSTTQVATMLPTPNTQNVQLSAISRLIRNPKFWPKKPVMKRHQLTLQREQTLELLVGRAGEYGCFQVVDLVVQVGQDWEEAVGQRVKDPIEEELLGVEHPPVELVALLIQRRQRIAVDRHDPVSGDEQMDLAQVLRTAGLVPPRAVEDEEDVLAVIVKLGALPEALSVLECERMETEDLAQPGEILVARRRQVEPEEVVPLDVVPDMALVDAREARHLEA